MKDRMKRETDTHDVDSDDDRNRRATRWWPLTAAIIWLLDRLPDAARHDVLDSFLSTAELAEMNRKADETFEKFGAKRQPKPSETKAI